jgi:hypothetical protein
MTPPNNYLFEDESTPTDLKMSEHEEMGLAGLGPACLGSVERIGLGPANVGGLAGYLHHTASAGYWPPIIYDWSDNPIGSQTLQLQQQLNRDESLHRGQ